MASVLSLLKDKDEIRDLLASYCLNLDSGAYTKTAALFAKDGILDVGPLGKAKGPEAIRNLIGAGGPEGKPTVYKHCTINSLIQVKKNEAHVESYLVVFQDGGQSIVTGMAGRYEDRLVKQRGQWRFRIRTVRFDICPIPFSGRRVREDIAAASK